MGRKKKHRLRNGSRRRTKIILEKLNCMYCLKEMEEKEIFRACKCKGSHVAHKKCIEEFIKRNNYRCSVCNTEYNLKYNIPTDYDVLKIIFKEYADNFIVNLSGLLSFTVSFFRTAFKGFIESSKIFIVFGVPIICRLALYISIIYGNYSLNYYLLSKFVKDLMVLKLLSVGSLCINYPAFDWFVNIGRNISRRKDAIMRNKSSNFEVLPYQEKSRFI